MPIATSPAVEAVRARPESAEELWRRVVESGTPLVEIDDDADPSARATGTVLVTFLWRGDAERVVLLANKLTGLGHDGDAELEHLPASDLWARTLRLPVDWRGSYSLAVVPRGAAGPRPDAPVDVRRARSLAATPPERHAEVEAWYDTISWAAPDPLARERSAEGSVGAGPDAPRLELAPPGRVGRVVRIDLPGGRRGWWHLPDGDSPACWDVRVLLDGERYVDADGAAPVLDAWTEWGIPARASLLVDSGGFAQRVRDLGCSPDLLAAIAAALADPALPELLGAPVTEDPCRTSIAGSSLGGLTALYAQCAAPWRFGTSVSQSGSFWWPGGAEGEWLTDAIAASAPRLGRVHLEVGTLEWVLLESTRRLRAVLEECAESVTYREFCGGHDRACWQVQLPQVLRDLGA